MFNKLRGKLVETMGNFGMIETIIISYDYYKLLSTYEIDELEAYMPTNSKTKWIILNSVEGFFSYLYRHPPSNK